MPEKTVQKESGKKPVPSKKPKPQQEVVVQIPLSELHPFPDHPFQVREDASMQETAESVKEYGVLVPALARPREDGGYELIAGHRRKHACELAGLATMPVIVRNIDRDAATIIMVDSNLQRENILPSERAKAYKIHNRRMPHCGDAVSHFCRRSNTFPSLQRALQRRLLTCWSTEKRSRRKSARKQNAIRIEHLPAAKMTKIWSAKMPASITIPTL